MGGPTDSTIVVSTAQALRDLTFSEADPPDHVRTMGALIAGDEGHGIWRWDADSAETDNLGTVINPTGRTTAGRWKRQFLVGSAWNVRWFGTQGVPLQQDAGAKIFIPKGIYRR